ncbi:MAG: hypothetical protein EXR58_01240 [Chloroflexi bacterium]|nr:hypothetical protein [Chloroflexota bacterium]
MALDRPSAAPSRPDGLNEPKPRWPVPLQWQLTRQWAGLVAILVAYMALAFWYSAATPPLEAGDEMRQFFMIRQIANGNGLPILDPTDNRPDTPSQEAGQPPLYHFLASLAIADLDTDDILSLAANPHALVGIPSTDSRNKNRVVHPSNEATLQGVAAVHRGRLLSIAFGLLTVATAYLLGRRVVPTEPTVAFLAASLVAFNPMFLFVSASVANDSAVAAVSTLLLVLLVPTLRGALTVPRTWTLGLVAGAGALTKLSGLALVPLSLAVVALAAKPRGWRALVGHGALLGGTAATVAGWWYLRNLSLYGDPTGLSAWLKVSGVRTEPFALEELRGFWLGFWGIFGTFDIIAAPWVYAIYTVLSLAGALGAIVVLRARFNTIDRPVLGLTLAWLAIEAAALIRWTSMNLASTGRLLFPAIACVAIFFALGLLLPLAERTRPKVALAVAVGLSGLAAIIPIQWLLPAYQPYSLTSAAELASAPLHPEIRFGNTIELTGAAIPPQTAAGEPIEVQLFWKALGRSSQNYSIGLHLIGRDGGRIGQIDAYPGSGRYPTSFWQPGDLVKDSISVPVDTPIAGPTAVRVVLSVYQLEQGTALDATNQRGEIVYPVLIGSSEIASAPDPRCTPDDPSRTFGGALQLFGAPLIPATARAGDPLPISLNWCTKTRLATDYTAFVHLARLDQPPVAQDDRPPHQGLYPTSIWAPGELVPDFHTLLIPSTAPLGKYSILVGLYDSSGRRLVTAPGRDTNVLGELEIVAPSSTV